MNKRPLPLFAALALSAASSIAQNSSELFPLPDGLNPIDPAQVAAAAAAVTPSAYPDANTVIMDSLSLETYEPDGTSVLFDDTFTKILTEKGRRSEMTSSFHFDAFYTEIEILAVQILKADGTTVSLDPAAVSSTAIDTAMMSSNIYDPNDKILTVSFPGVEIGDITRVAIRKTERKARVPGVWSDYQIFENFEPILHYAYAISSPTNLPVRRIALRDEVPGTAVAREPRPLGDGSRTLLEWEFSEIPQVFPEPSMPPLHTVCQRLLVSTSADWRDLSKWYWELSKPHLDAVSDEMRELVTSLTNEVAFTQERIWRIFTWVSQNVRYMGVTTETESPGYEPHDVSVTFGRRHGVCRDKAALLVSLLRLAGIDAFPVLIHVGEKRDPEVPMTFFNHAIVGVRESDGSYQLMDPTNENSADLLPPYLAGKSFLVATPQGETLMVSEDIPASANMVFIASKAKVNAAGDITINSKFSFTGLNDSAYRGALVRMPADTRREFLEGLVKETCPGGRLVSFSFEPEDLRDTETPLAINIEASAPDFVTHGDAADLIHVEKFSSRVGCHNFILDSIGLVERRFPLETEDACGAEETMEIEFESLGDAIALPDNISFKTNGITFSQSFFASGAAEGEKRRITAKSRFEFNLTSYPPELYKPLKATMKEIERLSSQIAAFKPAPTREELAADSRILERKTFIDVHSANSWTETTRIRRLIQTYAGRRACSEIKLHYNPAWENVTILEANVTDASGEVHLATESEINVMDASWAAAAPRYPASKTMVVSLPGVDVGSVISTAWEISTTNAPFFSFERVFNSSTPRDIDELVIRYPAALEKKFDDGPDYFLSDPGKVVFERNAGDDGFVVLRACAVHPETLPREPRLPDPENYSLVASFSFGNWDDYAAVLRKAVSDAIAPSNTKECARLAVSLCKGRRTVREKITAIRDFVAKNIRLAGPSFTDLPVSATPADVVLADGYGNLLDRAVLISALLLDAGIDNTVVFAADEDLEEFFEGDVSRHLLVESPNVFKHPLVEVRLDEDSRPIYLNDTDQYAKLGMMHHHGCLALTTLADDEDIGMISEDEDFDIGPLGPVKRIEAELEFMPIQSLSMEIDLERDGSAKVHVVSMYQGNGADGFLKRVCEMTPEQLRREHQELAGALSYSAVPTGELELQTNSLPYSLSFSADIPRFATRTGNILTLDVSDDNSIAEFDADTRKLPFRIGRSDASFRTVSVKLPAETKAVISMPPSVEWFYNAIGLAAFVRRSSLAEDPDDGRLVYEGKTERGMQKSAVFGPEFYKTILEMNRRLGSRESHLLVIEVEGE